MVRTNIKLGYKLESSNVREIVLGGPCRPFVGLPITRCPHSATRPGKNSAWFEFCVLLLRVKMGFRF